MMNSLAVLIERAAQVFPDNIALEDEHGETSYGELRRLSRAMASGLLGTGAGREAPVAVFLPKGSACVVCFYGTLYCGAPYAPMDYNAPVARISATLQSLRPACVITDAPGRERLDACGVTCPVADYEALVNTPEDREGVERALRATLDTDPAYIMYTSGSTGVPKGVAIPHCGVISYSQWVVETFRVTADTVFGMQSGFHFDNSVLDLYAALRQGAKVVIIPEPLFMYPRELMGYVAEKKINFIFWVPTVMISVANAGVLDGEALRELKTVLFAGEVMPNKQLNIWRKNLPDALYANLYGPTEITDVCCYYVVDRPFADADPMPLGRACEDMRLYILREDGTQADVGEEGELCVAGTGVALGYWNAPELTEKAFTANPLNPNWPERLYRTGDIAYRSDEGLIMFCGRRDNQIKLRGNRIELGDIETAARSLPGIKNACALFDSEGERIVLFLETKEQLNQRKCKLELGKLIPKYMVPTALVTMERFPLTLTRKIDRTALKAMMAQN